MPWIELDSSLLQAAHYQDHLLLELEFCDGAIYQYLGVPEPIFQDLLLAESPGGYFNVHIRKRFAETKIRPADPSRRPARVKV